MYSIILGAIIGLIGGVIYFRCNKGDRFDLCFNTVIGSVIGAVVGLVCSFMVASAMPKTEVVYGPAQLVAMRSADGVNGAFIFGTGGFRNSTNYNFLMKNADGSMVPGSVTADGYVHITEVESLKTSGTWTSTYSECDPKSVFYAWAIGVRDQKTLIRQDFRVPVGTVVQQFRVQ